MLKVKTGLIYLLALFAFYRRTVIDFVFRTKQIDDLVFLCSCILLEVNVIPVSIALKQNLKKDDSTMTRFNEMECVLK